MKNMIGIMVLCAIMGAQVGCTTTTRRFAANETRQAVAGYAEEDIQLAISRALQSILSLDRIKLHDGANRAVMIVENIKNNTSSRGSFAGALAQNLGQRLRKELTNSGKIVVLNRDAAKYATVKINPQYHLSGVLNERYLRQDNDDVQREYNLILTMVDLATGLEFWQEDIQIGKLVGEENINK